MSLSEIPSVKITFSTSQDISDEILGGTMSFCEEIGYKQNIIMLTFLWSGFLLASKSQLDEHNLVEGVLNCYIHSLSVLFPKLTEDVGLKKQVGEMLQHYWNNLNHDFKDLETEAAVSKYLQIANSLNSQDNAVSTYLLNKNPNAPFLQVSSTIRSSIYRILHQIDNGMGIKYRNAVKYAFIQQPQSTAKSETRPQSQAATIRPTAPRAQNDDFNPWKKIIVWGLIFITLSVLIVFGIAANGASSSYIPQDNTLTAIQEPRSGAILLGQEYLNGSKLTITASSGASYVVKLKTSSGTTRLSFYVRAGETITVGVPQERLYVYFASGDTWYGEKHLFGSHTSYSMDDELCDFTQGTWTYTLYPVTNGNFSETPIDPDEF